MSMPVRPSTPVAQSISGTPQTGKWRHPKLDEIVRRQNASSFSERNVRLIFYNVGGLVSFWLLGRIVWEMFPSLLHTSKGFQPYSTYLYHFIQVVFFYNIALAVLPLFRAKDEVQDIPLTPGQRKLLGLPPSSAPPTPGSSYLTPPRFARTPTSLGGSPASRGKFSESPLSGKGSPVSISGSPFSPVSSPLLQKAIGGDLNGHRRHSYGSSSLGPGASRANLPEAPGTPSPSASKGANIGLNSKWLYEKGRRNSGNARLYL